MVNTDMTDADDVTWAPTTGKMESGIIYDARPVGWFTRLLRRLRLVRGPIIAVLDLEEVVDV